jgi:hypothetical protein
MEVLPGIAQVLRSPVADAIVNLIRSSLRQREFDLADAEEMLKYAVRRNLMSQDESDRVLAEARQVVQRRAERAAERATHAPAKKAAAAAKKAARPNHSRPARPKASSSNPRKSKSPRRDTKSAKKKR